MYYEQVNTYTMIDNMPLDTVLAWLSIHLKINDDGLLQDCSNHIDNVL